MSKTVKEIAKAIDHSILHPMMTDEILKQECLVAIKYDVASVCVKPYAVEQAKEMLQGTDVAVGCVIGFPHGNSSIQVKVYEAEQACREGATEIDMVINIGKAIGGDWDYIRKEIEAITTACHQYRSIVKVIFETDFVTRTEDKIRLCEICTRAGADFVKTSTGYGFVKQSDGQYNYTGATADDVRLMRKYSGPDVRVKAAGGIRTLHDMIWILDSGAARIGATATVAMMEEAMKRYGNTIK